MNPTQVVAALESRIGVVIVRWSVRVLFGLSVFAWFLMGADGPEDPHFEGEGDGASSRTLVPGFEEVAFRVEPAPGLDSEKRDYCAMHAVSSEKRAQGMQHQDDFSGYDGMVFTFEEDSLAGFINHNVPIGLSIAWFAADGRFVSATDMPPCPSGVGCPTFKPAGPFRTALEIPAGRLDDLGIAPGARLRVGGACT